MNHHIRLNELETKMAMSALGQQVSGAYPVDSRVRKIEAQEGDLHPAGSTGTILGSIGPISASPSDPQWAGELVIGYFLIWDDLPEQLAFVLSPKLELVDEASPPEPSQKLCSPNRPPQDRQGPSVQERSGEGRGPGGKP